MYGVCADCGASGAMDGPVAADSILTCPECGYEQPYLRLPLFVVVGASGAGKSTMAKDLTALDEAPAAVYLDSDILLIEPFAGNGWEEYRETWVWLCFNIAQSGRPVVLFGGGDPGDYASVSWMRFFSDTHYLALTCGPDELERRLRDRPAWRGSAEPEFVARQLDWNASLMTGSRPGGHTWDALSTSGRHQDDTARGIALWMRRHWRW